MNEKDLWVENEMYRTIVKKAKYEFYTKQKIHRNCATNMQSSAIGM